MKILYLLSSLEYSGAARQALMLGQGLAGTCDLRICVMQGAGPWGAFLRGAGIPVHSLGWTRPLDPLPLWRLHRLLREFQPDCIHVWRGQALRTLALAGRNFLPRCIVCRPLAGIQARPRLSKWDRWLLRRVGTIVAGGTSEAQTLEQLGFGPNQVQIIPPGVEVGQGISERRLDIPVRPGTDKNVHPTAKEDMNVQPQGRRVVCLGNLEARKGFRQACQAADFLAYPFTDLHLNLIGSGPYLHSLQRFQRGVFHRDHIHFLGAQPDALQYLAQADICWVPSLTGTGSQVALEAMAVARPVIAPDLPPFREIIATGESGFLVPPGDIMALIRRTRELFLDDSLRRRLGAGARKRVEEHFAAADFIEKFRALYGAGQPDLFPQNDCQGRTELLVKEE